MIQNVEQALFCLLSPSIDAEEQTNYCKNCEYAEMCGRVIAIIVEWKQHHKQKPDA